MPVLSVELSSPRKLALAGEEYSCSNQFCLIQNGATTHALTACASSFVNVNPRWLDGSFPFSVDRQSFAGLSVNLRSRRTHIHKHRHVIRAKESSSVSAFVSILSLVCPKTRTRKNIDI